MNKAILSPTCRRCGTYLNVLKNGYVCPNCNYEEKTTSSDSTTPTEPNVRKDNYERSRNNMQNRHLWVDN